MLARAFATIVILSCGALPAQAERDIKQSILWVITDGRGEVVITKRGNGMLSFWSLADGKLIEKMEFNDVQLPIRALRHKLQGEFLLTGFGNTFKSTADSTVEVLSTNGEATLRFAKHNKDTLGYVRNRATKTIAVYGMKGGIASILLVDATDPVDESGRLKGRSLPPFARPASDFSLSYSPKGAWLIDYNQRQLINTQSGGLISFAAGVEKGDEFNSSGTFSPDEALFAIGIEGYGMKVFDTKTGKLTNSYPLPSSLRSKKGYVVYPATDCKSYVYTGSIGTYFKFRDLTMEDAFLVKGGEVIELKE